MPHTQQGVTHASCMRPLFSLCATLLVDVHCARSCSDRFICARSLPTVSLGAARSSPATTVLANCGNVNAGRSVLEGEKQRPPLQHTSGVQKDRRVGRAAPRWFACQANSGRHCPHDFRCRSFGPSSVHDLKSGSSLRFRDL